VITAVEHARSTRQSNFVLSASSEIGYLQSHRDHHDWGIGVLWAELRRLGFRHWTHFGSTFVLLVLSYPLCQALGLEIHSPIVLLKGLPAIIAQGISLAAVLFAVQNPEQVVTRLRQGDYRRFLFLLPVFCLLFFLYRPVDAALFSVGAVAIAEYLSAQEGSWRSPVVSSLLPSAYFLFGFGLVYTFNDIVACVRFYGLYDDWLLKADSWILFGGSVSSFSAWAQAHTFPGFFRLVEGIYFGAFAQVGAGIVLVGVMTGMSRALRLVGTLLLAYYMSLACFVLFPSHGPYLLCADHFRTFPDTLTSYKIQQIFVANVRTLWHHAGVVASTGGYYLSFPCMHITQPLIILRFLRYSRRVAAVLAAYDLLLVPSILLLEWHYAVDILGGVLVAVFAIYLVGDKNVRGTYPFRCGSAT
jgi:hypothetical protein